MNNISERLGLVVHWLGWLCTIFIVVIIFHTNSYHLFDDEYPYITSNASEECKELLREYDDHVANERWTESSNIDKDEYWTCRFRETETITIMKPSEGSILRWLERSIDDIVFEFPEVLLFLSFLMGWLIRFILVGKVHILPWK
ncbi:hypothetical protein N8224_01210 [Gammaproteobacteria bacterium]|jgi:hypothetical protein|nr:hypothetical protein [Gammaproteobacteria bacterium]